MERPKTLAEFQALPEVGFGMREELIDGKMVRIPVAPDLVLFWSEDADFTHYVDAEGVRWALAQHADGRWCRRRA